MLRNSETVERIGLPNGLQVIMVPRSSSSMSSVSLVFPFGANLEQGASGRAHLLEHVYFGLRDETLSTQPAGLVNFETLHSNAATYPDNTSFFYSVPSHALRQSLRKEGTRFSRRLDWLTEELVEREKRVVLAELRETRESGIAKALEDAQNAILNHSTGYLGSILGKACNVAETTYSDVKHLLAQKYRLSGAVCAVTGRFNRDDVLRELESWSDDSRGEPFTSTVKSHPVGGDWLYWQAPGLSDGNAVPLLILLYYLNSYFREKKTRIHFHWRGAKNSSLILASNHEELFFSKDQDFLAAHVEQALDDLTESGFKTARDSLLLSHLYTRYQEGGMTGYAQRLARGLCVYGHEQALLIASPYLIASFSEAKNIIRRTLRLKCISEKKIEDTTREFSNASTGHLTDVNEPRSISETPEEDIFTLCERRFPEISWRRIPHRDPLLSEILIEWQIQPKTHTPYVLSEQVLLAASQQISKRLKSIFQSVAKESSMSFRFVENAVRCEVTLLKSHLEDFLSSLSKNMLSLNISFNDFQSTVQSIVLAVGTETIDPTWENFTQTPTFENLRPIFRQMLLKEFSSCLSGKFFQNIRTGDEPIYDYDLNITADKHCLKITFGCPTDITSQRKKDFALNAASIFQGYKTSDSEFSRWVSVVESIRLGAEHAQLTPHLACHRNLKTNSVTALDWLLFRKMTTEDLVKEFLEWIRSTDLEIRVATRAA